MRYIEDNDGDDAPVFSMPLSCTKFECQKWIGKCRARPLLKEYNGFMTCPKCGASYGSTEKEWNKS